MASRYRWVLLLLASYYFYMCWKPEYIILIIISTLIDYFAGLKMGQQETRQARKKYLWLSLGSNLGILGLFKYFNFFSDSLRTTLNTFNIFYDSPVFDMLLPVGISFYTFQTLSYTIEVYRGKQKPERHLGIFALYVSFFPQLVAGPIERSTRLLPQFFREHQFEYQQVSDGLKQVMWGFFKKVVIADRVAVAVNHVYGQPTEYSGFILVAATVLFSFQIYCDFSGYSDIAIGSAKILGYDLMKNFDSPYFSRSISEFWKRWHISLSTWFRDYVYIPLGGNRATKHRWYFNLFVTFVISGLWHGANWTFVIWGALNGFYLVFAIWTAGVRGKIAGIVGLDRVAWLNNGWKIAVTYSLTIVAWVFFRANSVGDAFFILEQFFVGWGNTVAALQNPQQLVLLLSQLGLQRSEFIIAVVAIVVLLVVEILQQRMPLLQKFNRQPIAVRWFAYYVLLFAVLFGGAFHSSQDFIYFQF